MKVWPIEGTQRLVNTINNVQDKPVDEILKDVNDLLEFIDQNATCVLCGKVGCKCEVALSI